MDHSQFATTITTTTTIPIQNKGDELERKYDFVDMDGKDGEGGSARTIATITRVESKEMSIAKRNGKGRYFWRYIYIASNLQTHKT